MYISLHNSCHLHKTCEALQDIKYETERRIKIVLRKEYKKNSYLIILGIRKQTVAKFHLKNEKRMILHQLQQ